MLNARVFRVSSGLGVAAIAVLSVLFLTAQQAFPFFIGNVGTFMIKADSIEGNGFELALGVDENSNTNGGELPTGELALDSLTIDALVVEKAFDVRSVIGDIAQPEWKLQLTSSAPVDLGDTRINAVGLCADVFDAGNLVIDAKGADTATFTDDFVLASDSLTLTGAGIEAGYLSTGSITITGLQAAVIPGGYDPATCLPQN